jgi:hypothetical protein
MHDLTPSASFDRRRAPSRAPFPIEIYAVWALFAVVTVEIFVTYARLPAGDLYHVSGTGLVGGASRALVFLDFPLALVTIPIAVLLYPRLGSRRARAAAVLGVLLSAVVFWPGVVKESDLDARTVNAVPALGVLLVALLTLRVATSSARPSRLERVSWDRLRIAIAVLALALALPWMAAELGVSFDGIPVLGTLYQTGELRAPPDVTPLHPAVHHGHHHGMDGALLVWTALLLSRLLPTFSRRPQRLALGAYLALMLSYGAGNVANDFWVEQVVKRDWTDWRIPDVTTPKASVAWALILFAAAVVWSLGVVLTRSQRPGPEVPTPASEAP